LPVLVVGAVAAVVVMLRRENRARLVAIAG